MKERFRRRRRKGRNNFEKQQELYRNVSEAKSPGDSEACENYYQQEK